MKDLRHDNVNQFIGACVDPPNILLVIEYCSKGSLQVGNPTRIQQNPFLWVCSVANVQVHSGRITRLQGKSSKQTSYAAFKVIKLAFKLSRCFRLMYFKSLLPRYVLSCLAISGYFGKR